MGNYASNRLEIETIAGDAGYKGVVIIEPQHSLHDVRCLIREEFDEEMVPQPDFYFAINGVRLGKKQEKRLKAAELLRDEYRVQILSVSVNQPIMKKRKADLSTDVNETPRKKECQTEVPSPQAVTSKSNEVCNLAPLKSAEMSLGTAQEPSNGGITGSTLMSKEVPSLGEAHGPSEHFTEITLEMEELLPVLEQGARDPLEQIAGSISEDYSVPNTCGSEEEEFGIEDDNTCAEENVSRDDCSDDSLVVRSDEKHSSQTAQSKYEKQDLVSSEVEADINEVQEIIVTKKKNNQHARYDEALQQSKLVLNKIKKLLECNPLFCSHERHEQWRQDIFKILCMQEHKTVIGMLGSTGVGKSSLLNALLDEAAVLPTSGSRGCTATVVELRFNEELRFQQTDTNCSDTKVPIYKGEIEFVMLTEWQIELKILINECCSEHEETLDKKSPEACQQPIAAAAWQKLDQVYGRGTMQKYCGKAKEHVYNILVKDRRVSQLLRPTTSLMQHNTLVVKEGYTTPENAKTLLQDFARLSPDKKKVRQIMAERFRNQINDYVYRKGNGDEPQTWPLISKVVVEGPWPVLATGASLVDLPGVRDANMARAKVSEAYVKNCNEIWIVAPIKRAVDDGTAKELMGKQFKRRLLMDGAYENVSFICTQTDDCETTETMRDHQDLAIELGYWQRITELSANLGLINQDLGNLREREAVLRADHERALKQVNSLSRKLEKCVKNIIAIDESKSKDLTGLNDRREKLFSQQQAWLMRKKDKTIAANATLVKLTVWTKKNKETLEKLEKQSRKLQLKLKSRCALVRNTYSTACLKYDFKAGLEELLREVNVHDDEKREGATSQCEENEDKIENPDVENTNRSAEGDGMGEYKSDKSMKVDDGQNDVDERREDENTRFLAQKDALRKAELEVFCVSANDYLKVQHIKLERDGPPNTFTRSTDTQIPCLRTFIHSTTSKRRVVSTKAFVNETSNLLNRVKLIATKGSNGSSTRLFKSMFEREIESCAERLQAVVDEFVANIKEKIQFKLQPSLKAGAAQAKSVAMSTVESWGSRNRRSATERSVTQNGLHHSTYLATVARNGTYVSGSVGLIDLNHEICDPMEKEVSSEWQHVMDSAIASFLQKSKLQASEICLLLDNNLATQFTNAGMLPSRLRAIATTASRSCASLLDASFREMHTIAKRTQRDLNRFILETIRQQMADGYNAATEVTGGAGRFRRMQDAMTAHARDCTVSMFDEPRKELLEQITALINVLANRISVLFQNIYVTMEDVYSVCWDECEISKLVRNCRDSLLPDLHQLTMAQGKAIDLMGLEKQPLDLDLTAVASWDDVYQNKLHEAERTGKVVDLVDSDSDSDTHHQDLLPRDALLEKPENVSSSVSCHV